MSSFKKETAIQKNAKQRTDKNDNGPHILEIRNFENYITERITQHINLILANHICFAEPSQYLGILFLWLKWKAESVC